MPRVRPPLPDGPFLVLGLARSGVAVVRALLGAGQEVLGADERELYDPALEGVRVQRGDGVDLLDRVRVLVKSPGVPQSAPAVVAAREQGIPVLGELEIAWRLLPNRFVAVTGSNGKTTTVEMIGHVFRTAGVPARVAGNVGTALSSLVGEVEAETTIVCEASSFQLEDADAFAPEVAVLLNLVPDHLDRHGTFDAYRAAKLRIFARQGPDDVAIAPAGMELPGAARRVPTVSLVPGDLRVSGDHNLRNGEAAITAAIVCGIDEEMARDALHHFRGVRHRLEEVARIEEVTWVNDSKATNVDAALTALASFPGGVHLIAGGQGKGQDFAPLRAPVRDRCRAVYLIGEDAPAIAQALGEDGPPLVDCGTLERAVAAARDAAADGETVLFSPACASFDQFRDFEARGDRFRELVLDG
jgi:UDP-N-acetylmuramoylalanine--D-glutamate ligase